MTPKPTTIILAIIIGTAAASQANAYEVTAPPDIESAARECNGAMRDSLVTGRRCLHMIVNGVKDHNSCDMTISASKIVADNCPVVGKWITAQIDKGATSITNINTDLAAAREYSELMTDLIRAMKY